MNRHCLICESEAVLTREATRGLALLIGLLGAAMRGAQHNQNESGYDRLLNGLAAITPACPDALEGAKDVARHHFAAGFDCLCLHCGAMFDRNAEHNNPTG
ncbi:TPA: hypothetical protein L6B67_01285 [Pseudomonas aeruginosa]|nr:hypothetical protein [Pseudomonas aeruginosa]